MTLSMIHVKTAKGMAEVRSRSNALSPVARRVLIMIDGRRSEADLAPVVRDGELDAILATLRSLGMIEECGVVDVSPPAPEEVDDEETVMLAPPAVRLELGIAPSRPTAPATVAAPPPPPPTLRVPFDLRPGTLGTTPSPLVERRSPPNAAPPAPMPAAAAAMAADVAHGAATAPQVTPVAPPPPRVLPPMNTTPPLRRVVVAPASPPSPPAPAPASATATKPVSFEETRRRAVSALYERLGPYGEEPAARLQDCKSLDALREQIEHACKRITTFRGEAAACDYRAGLGLG